MTKYACLAALVFAFSAAFGQPKSDFRLWADAAAFRYDGDNSFLECYYAFPRDAVTLQQDEGGFKGSVIMSAVIAADREAGNPISRVWRVPVAFSDADAAANRLMIGKVSFTLVPGRYRLSLSARDESQSAIGDTAEFPFEVREFPLRAPVISDIELCASLRQIDRDTSNIFYKNTLEAVPNPTI